MGTVVEVSLLSVLVSGDVYSTAGGGGLGVDGAHTGRRQWTLLRHRHLSVLTVLARPGPAAELNTARSSADLLRATRPRQVLCPSLVLDRVQSANIVQRLVLDRLIDHAADEEWYWIWCEVPTQYHTWYWIEREVLIEYQPDLLAGGEEWYWIDFTLLAFVPFVVVLTGNCVMVTCVVKAVRFRYRRETQPAGPARTSGTATTTAGDKGKAVTSSTVMLMTLSVDRYHNTLKDTKAVHLSGQTRSQYHRLHLLDKGLNQRLGFQVQVPRSMTTSHQ